MALLSPLLNEASNDANGNPLSGGKIQSFVAGSTTPQATFQDSAGTIAHANPIILNSRGEPPALIWLAQSASYKLVLKDSVDVTVRTMDGVSGIAAAAAAADEWLVFSGTPTFVSGTSFTLVGDQTTEFQVNRRVKSINSGGTRFSTISSSVFTTLTTVTVTNDSGVLDSGLSSVFLGLLRATNTSVPPNIASGTFTDTTAVVQGSADSTKKVKIEADGLTTGTTRTMTMPDRDIDLGGVTPTGGVIEFGGLVLPASYLWADGSAVSRSTFAGLFAALVKSATVTADSTTDRITWTAHGLRDYMPFKASSSGTMPGGLTTGVTYWIRDSATNDFKLSLVPGGVAIDITSNGTGTITGVCTPYGDGDGSTTFNTPARMGRVAVGFGANTLVESFAAAAVTTGTDSIAVADNVATWITGMSVVLTTSGSAPGGLTAGNTYFVIRTGQAVIKLALTLANAQNGTAIDITSQGTGTHTITHTIQTRGMGERFGEDVHAMSITELLAHTHPAQLGDSGVSNNALNAGNPSGTLTTGSTGGNAAMNNAQPSIGMGYIIKT